MTAARTYHHGNLRNALLDAALGILARDGFHALTLRRVAAQANVSHAAPAHYFPAVEALLTALAAIGFTKLKAVLREVRLTKGADVAKYTDAFVAAYLAFSENEKGMFELMFASHRIDWQDDVLKSSSKNAYAELECLAEAIAKVRGDPGADARVALEQLIWSTAHGYALLALGRQVPKPGQKRPAAPPKLSEFLLPAAKRAK